jgi:hypothetical protein
MINKLCNIAFGLNDEISAKKAIALMLADEINDERKKARALADLTPEALLEKAERKKSCNS